MSVQIKEVNTKKELKEFVSFPFALYSDNPYWVPPVIDQEMNVFGDKNPVMHHCDIKLWIAEKDGKTAGRIAGIINNEYIAKWGKRHARFGWFDCIDDTEVSRALFSTAEKWAVSSGMEAVHGPLGFTDFDTEGILVEGFDQLATIVERYNHPYYEKLILDSGFRKDAGWVEYRVRIPDEIPAKIKRVADYVRTKHQLRLAKLEKPQDTHKYIPEIINMINDVYGLLYGFTPITQEIMDFYVSRYINYLDTDLVTIMLDQNERVAAFAVTMPSVSKFLQKSKGKVDFLSLIKNRKEILKTDVLDMYFIGARPEYINKGISAVLIDEMGKSVIAKGFKYAETNIEYESNQEVQSLWKNFDYELHKRRRCYMKLLLGRTRKEDNI